MSCWVVDSHFGKSRCVEGSSLADDSDQSCRLTGLIHHHCSIVRKKFRRNCSQEVSVLFKPPEESRTHQRNRFQGREKKSRRAKIIFWGKKDTEVYFIAFSLHSIHSVWIKKVNWSGLRLRLSYQNKSVWKLMRRKIISESTIFDSGSSLNRSWNLSWSEVF